MHPYLEDLQKISAAIHSNYPEHQLREGRQKVVLGAAAGCVLGSVAAPSSCASPIVGGAIGCSLLTWLESRHRLNRIDQIIQTVAQSQGFSSIQAQDYFVNKKKPTFAEAEMTQLVTEINQSNLLLQLHHFAKGCLPLEVLQQIYFPPTPMAMQR